MPRTYNAISRRGNNDGQSMNPCNTILDMPLNDGQSINPCRSLGLATRFHDVWTCGNNNGQSIIPYKASNLQCDFTTFEHAITNRLIPARRQTCKMRHGQLINPCRGLELATRFHNLWTCGNNNGQSINPHKASNLQRDFMTFEHAATAIANQLIPARHHNLQRDFEHAATMMANRLIPARHHNYNDGQSINPCTTSLVVEYNSGWERCNTSSLVAESWLIHYLRDALLWVRELSPTTFIQSRYIYICHSAQPSQLITIHSTSLSA